MYGMTYQAEYGVTDRAELERKGRAGARTGRRRTRESAAGRLVRQSLRELGLVAVSLSGAFLVLGLL